LAGKRLFRFAGKPPGGVPDGLPANFRRRSLNDFSVIANDLSTIANDRQRSPGE